jgi:two-component system, OmpR family, sensor kinase
MISISRTIVFSHLMKSQDSASKTCFLLVQTMRKNTKKHNQRQEQQEARKYFSVPGLPRSLRGRLVLWNILVLLLTLAILEVIIYGVVSSYLMSNVDRQLQQQAAKLQSATHIWQASARPFDSQFLDQLARADQRDEFTSDAPYIKLLDAQDGHLLRRSPNLGKIRLPLNSADFRSAVQNLSPLKTYQDNSGRQVRILTVALRDTGQHIVVIAQIGHSLEAINQVQFILSLVLGIGGLCAVLIVCTGGLWVTNRELRPLLALSTTMLNVSTQRLGLRLPPDQSVAEIQSLTDAFNRMSERLEASFALQRSFVADVSHELRTPLTAVRGQLDVLALNPALEEETQQDIQQIRAELARMSRLVNNLLTHARAEAGVFPHIPPESMQSVDLDALLIGIARQIRFLNRPAALRLRQLQQANVSGDSDLLKQLILNLIDNALTYTPADGDVSLALLLTRDIPDALQHDSKDKQDVWARIDVCDTGPGIAPTDLPHIFERNYRANSTNARGKLSSGLGLSIGLLIAQAHGGTITVESAIDQGTCFSIWLPQEHFPD